MGPQMQSVILKRSTPLYQNQSLFFSHGREARINFRFKRLSQS